MKIEREFAAMSDEELRKIAEGDESDEFAGMTDEQLLELIARSEGRSLSSKGAANVPSVNFPLIR